MNTISASFQLTKDRFILDASFTIPSSGITAITGASGSGKTTILRCIAGLESPAKGHFHINDKQWFDRSENIFVPPHQRSVGYIFQDAALFPHMNVKQNLEYAYKRRNSGKHAIIWEDIINSISLDNLLDRNIGALSGGEKQRIAIARALLANPDILLMDEPISALDKKSRQSIIYLIEKIHKQHTIPIIYVSHCIEEISQLADRVICIENGRIICLGATNDILYSLKSETDIQPNLTRTQGF